MDIETYKTKKSTINIIEDDNDILKKTIKDFSENTNIVIDGSKEPLKNNTDWLIKDIPYSEPSEFEKELLKGTITTKELLEKEKEENEKQKELTYEEKLEQYKKEYITKVKVVALHKCKFHPVSNPSTFKKQDKEKVIMKMQKIIDNYKEDELTDEFNEIINNMLMDHRTKYEELPIMNK